jgi:hypothetical protein
LSDPIINRFAIYGVNVCISNSLNAMEPRIASFLKPFAVKRLIPNIAPATGEIRMFDLPEVNRSISSAASAHRGGDGLTEIYSLGEKHWIIDDRWGMCEINFLKHRWRSWVLPWPSLDPVRLVESAVLWPMAQLLRLRGIEWAPAISVERAGWGALILAPYSIPREISRLVRAGYRVIGQRWTAIVPQHGRMVLRHVPGVVEQPEAPGKRIGRETVWTDLTANNPWATANLASCDAVLTIAPGRRSTSCGRVMSAAEAQALLQRNWPIQELPLNRLRVQPAAAALVAQCLCVSLQLSSHEEEFIQLVEFARLRTKSRVQVTIRNALRRHFVPTTRPERTGRLAG